MKLKVDFKNTVGRIKPMNAVNNGPVYTDNGDQNLTNLPDFREANIPFARTHDSSICYDYGGEHTVDIHNIFTDFDADPYSPESYDFTLTDIYLSTIMRAGQRCFTASAVKSSIGRSTTALCRRRTIKNGRSSASTS